MRSPKKGAHSIRTKNETKLAAYTVSVDKRKEEKVELGKRTRKRCADTNAHTLTHRDAGGAYAYGI